jgi:hypothetical protein
MVKHEKETLDVDWVVKFDKKPLRLDEQKPKRSLLVEAMSPIGPMFDSRIPSFRWKKKPSESYSHDF